MLNDCIRVNNGTMRICPGTIMPARITQKRMFLPRNGTREKAKAARLARITVATLITAEVRMLLKYHCGRSLVVSTVTKACRVKCEASQEMGMAVVSPSGFSAV